MIRIIIATALLVCAAGSTPAAAQLACSASFTMEFGDINALDGMSETSSANLAINCSGGPVGETVRACATIEATREMAWQGGSGVISYDLSAVSAGGQSWPSLLDGATPSSLITLDGNGNGNAVIPVYGIIASPQATAPTQRTNTRYSDAPLVTVTSDIAAGHSDCATVVANVNAGPASVGADYVPACYMTTNPLNFGTLSSTLTGVDASTTLSARCSNAAPFTISMNYGSNGGIDPAVRYMRNGAQLMSYGIYLDGARSQGWGFTVGSNVYSASGSGTEVNIPVYGRIQPQPTPPSGTYTDTVVVTIEY